ncbi:MAG: diphthine synthase [Candidatus Poseidoniaceae archaeon]|jgi:diphthine synthase|nr:diphthine synthase [Candidatus Poseidoniaceae archaeon]
MAAGLVLVGIGLGGVSNMTMEALSAAKSADIRKFEGYTALWSAEHFVELEKEVGDIDKVMRPDVEEPVELLNLAKECVVALLVVGDPLQATTHVDLQLQAQDAGIDCKVIHGISITGVVTGAVGLSNYKFGRQTTITYPYRGWVPTSPLETIAMNRCQGLHTLVLLDLDPTGEGVGEQCPMQPADAADAVMLMSEKIMENIDSWEISDALWNMEIGAFKEVCSDITNLPVILCTDMGTDDQSITYLKLKDLHSAKEGRLHCLIIPSKLTDTEKAALHRWTK